MVSSIKGLDMKKEKKVFGYKTQEEKWLVPVYWSEPEQENPGHYPLLEVIGLASISNPLEPLQHIYFVSHS